MASEQQQRTCGRYRRKKPPRTMLTTKKAMLTMVPMSQKMVNMRSMGPRVVSMGSPTAPNPARCAPFPPAGTGMLAARCATTARTAG